jgi:hypothetical protein
MIENTNPYVKRLWLTYKLYGEVSKGSNQDLDSSAYATTCTLGYLEYVEGCLELYPEWKNNINGVLANQIRILTGFIECYDRPVKRDKLVHKTRWSL